MEWPSLATGEHLGLSLFLQGFRLHFSLGTRARLLHLDKWWKSPPGTILIWQSCKQALLNYQPVLIFFELCPPWFDLFLGIKYIEYSQPNQPRVKKIQTEKYLNLQLGSAHVVHVKHHRELDIFQNLCWTIKVFLGSIKIISQTLALTPASPSFLLCLKWNLTILSQCCLDVFDTHLAIWMVM